MEDQVRRRIGWGLYALATTAAVWFAVDRWLFALDLGASAFPMGWIRFRATMWAAAALTGAAFLAIGRGSARQALGIALLTVPLWAAFFGFLNSIPALQDGSTVLRPQTPYQLSSRYIRGILWDLSYLGLGFMLWAKPGPSIRAWAKRLRDAGFVVGVTEARSAWLGYIVFPFVLLVAWGLDWLINNVTPGLITGDESRYWENLSMYHTVMISAAAAFTEELVYRVVALAMFTWLGHRVGLSSKLAVALAVALQALLFAGAHGGYGSWAHVVYPLFFALFMAGLVLVAGVWAAVVIHFFIDFYVFGSEVAAHTPAVNTLLWTMLLLNVAATAAWLAWSVRRWLRGTPPWQGWLLAGRKSPED